MVVQTRKTGFRRLADRSIVPPPHLWYMYLLWVRQVAAQTGLHTYCFVARNNC